MDPAGRDGPPHVDARGSRGGRGARRPARRRRCVGEALGPGSDGPVEPTRCAPPRTVATWRQTSKKPMLKRARPSLRKCLGSPPSRQRRACGAAVLLTEETVAIKPNASSLCRGCRGRSPRSQLVAGQQQRAPPPVGAEMQLRPQPGLPGGAHRRCRRARPEHGRGHRARAEGVQQEPQLPDRSQGVRLPGRARHAPGLATKIVKTTSIFGLVGPGFSGESLATGKTFFAAGLPSISPSATNATITQSGWTTWHRVIGNDDSRVRPTWSTWRPPPAPEGLPHRRRPGLQQRPRRVRQGRARRGHRERETR